MKWLVSLGVLGLVWTPLAFALQTVSVGANQSASATIGLGDYNRLFIENDRILSVKGKQGQYQLQSDPQLGDVYLYPQQSDKPIVLYLSTEKKKTVQLKLEPQSIEAQTLAINIIEPKVVLNVDHKSGKQTPSQQKANYEHLIAQVKTNNPIEGFEKVVVKTTTRKPLQGHLQARLLSLYQNDNAQIEVYEIYNASKKPLEIHATLFKTPGTKAISPQHAVIPPHGTLSLLKVVSHG